MTKMNYNRPCFRKNLGERAYTPPKKGKRKHKKTNMKSSSNEFNTSEKMNFGKYKGFSLRVIPSNYLEWLISVTIEDNVAMKYARELANRPEYVKKLNMKITD